FDFSYENVVFANSFTIFNTFPKLTFIITPLLSAQPYLSHIGDHTRRTARQSQIHRRRDSDWQPDK
ncbi:hypothetical protein LINPERHAP2_LOCUS7174, partial [Linum perenne]